MKITNKVFLMFVNLLLTSLINADIIDLRTMEDCVKILENHTAMPDSKGVMNSFKLQVPEFSRGVYYRGQWWPYAGNRVLAHHLTSPEGEEGGIFLLLELKDKSYLAILPLCGDQAYSWLAPDKESFVLKFGTHGKAAIKGDFPLVAWSRADTPYEACSQVWEAASKAPQIKDHMKLRENKDYPEMFRYLGWCSWEEFHRNISSDKLVEQFKGLVASPAPVRYFLVDNGHFDKQSLIPTEETFPNGYKPLTDLRSDDGIRWVGMWHALMGVKNAIQETAQLGETRKHMMSTYNKQLVANPISEDVEAFLRYLFSYSKRDDIDFIKVDFYGALLPFYSGTPSKSVTANFPENNSNSIDNPVEATVNYARIFQGITKDIFSGLINCNWHQPHFLFNSADSIVGRCSADYSKGDLKKAKSHLYDSYAAIPWLGQIAWGDHDMFHSNDPFAGRMMAISKAFSGAPVYLSDPYDNLDIDNIKPLCYEDGLLLRPIAPAAPLTEDIFQPISAKRLFRVIAPLQNRSAAIAIYNLHGDAKEDKPEYSTTILPSDYGTAGGMIQPNTGSWGMPKDGLVVYDFNKETVQKLNDGYDVSIKGFGDHLLQLSPIRDGWSVIGRTDKYLSAAAVKILKSSPRILSVRLHESGPFAIWLESGVPKAKGINFTAKGNGLFVANLPVSAKSRRIEITRREDQ